MTDSLIINEIFYSIQGESSYAGFPCIFIRFTFCNLRCRYCDTSYAFFEGERYTIDEVITKVLKYKTPLVEITGGEPLLQEGVYPLIDKLLFNNKKVLLETNGSLPIDRIDKNVIKIVDFKCPSSNETDKNLFENIYYLNPFDEVKFVISDRIDYEWAKGIIYKYNILDKCKVVFSPVFGKIEPKMIVEWILKDQINIKFQLQIHKYIWSPELRGV